MTPPNHATLVWGREKGLPAAGRVIKPLASFVPWTPHSPGMRGEERLMRDVLLGQCLTLHQEQ